MSKTIKRIMSSLLVVAAFATVEPVKYFNLVTEKAYASSSFNSSDDALLDSLDTDEGTLNFSSTKSNVKGKVKKSIDEVNITAKAKDSNYKITIDGKEVTGDGSKELDLDKGRNSFKIYVEDPSGKKSSATYYVYITRGTSSSDRDDDDDDDDDNGDVYLEDITVNGKDISFSDTTRAYNVEVAQSTDQIKIKAEPKEDEDTVEIDGETVDEDKDYKRSVSLNQGKNVIKVKVEDDDDSDNDRTYTLNVYRGEKAPSGTVGVGEVDENQDSIYLESLKLLDSYGVNIDFKKKVTNYEVNVKDDCDNIIVKAEPDEGRVRVNDDDVDSNYNRRVNLQKGKNVINVKVENGYDSEDDDDYEKRIYTIVVNRGTTTGTTDTNTTNVNSNSTNNNATNTTVKTNQWVKNANGKWTYNDSLGKPMVNSWFYDVNYGKWYRFGYDGVMCTGWQYDNGKIYYLNEDGSMQIGAKYIGSVLYNFNGSGAMI